MEESVNARNKIQDVYEILEDIVMYLETMDTENISNNINKAMKILDQI
jgi:hypothetical protein